MSCFIIYILYCNKASWPFEALLYFMMLLGSTLSLYGMLGGPDEEELQNSIGEYY